MAGLFFSLSAQQKARAKLRNRGKPKAGADHFSALLS
jgi:hypothetical protein